ncbi:hypothetical protein [Collimonas silvisoli]|uniref:hypothetical protein n=1 Tax=Collimonas silvisoli TaxID=2825884 RepID=UPI001B8BCA5D|nr:hypothetical protein [Collimonas silvisoli]
MNNELGLIGDFLTLGQAGKDEAIALVRMAVERGVTLIVQPLALKRATSNLASP